ncbi:hypothetical protein TNCT_706921 [Trichonephila clavata]|uniref:Uncharacterized protein n=1 Tax=Trichonephila clavata TaxID=2740835 RepID=A0A8X6KYS0_TRICU|nr:hypothetical protein TNCT_706921 [Trichonephila clavata]
MNQVTLKTNAMNYETLEEEMVQIERQAPEKLKRPAIECIEQNSTKSKGIEVQCIGTMKILRPHYAAILEDSVVFSGCIMKALTDVDKDLSEEEIKKVDELMKRSKKIYDKIKKLKGGSSNSTSTGSGN